MPKQYRSRRNTTESTPRSDRRGKRGTRAPKARRKGGRTQSRATRVVSRRTDPKGDARPAGPYPSVALEGRLQDPTTEEVAREQTRIDEGVQSRRSAGHRAPAPGRDLLASYMDHLSHIPLFTPEQEARNARHLETLELHVWRLLLSHPRGSDHLNTEAPALDAKLARKLGRIHASYRRAAARTRARTLRPSKARSRLIDDAAADLRFADCDKELLDVVLRRMRRDVWSRRVFDSKPCYRVTHAELAEIERANGTATRARNNFVRANLRLVVSVARNFHHYRVPFLDLIQEGNVGLMKAIHRFDHKRGFRFSTYAHWWIRQSIERAIINRGTQIRLPVHVIDTRRQIGRVTAKLTQRLGRAPSSEEISHAVKMPRTKVEQIQGGVQPDPVSLDETVGKDDPRKFLDLVKDDEQPEIDEALIRENTYHRVREMLQLLNPIEKDIIRRRFGLGDDSDQTLDEIGQLYNLSRERVRQIQAQGLQKMRRMCERREISLSPA